MKTPTILIADDDPALLRAYSQIMRAIECNLLTADTGEGCLHLAREVVPDLILLDAALPDLTGVEVCQRIKADPVTERTFVILLSSRASDDEQVEGLESGADGYLTKPLSERTLMAHVRAFLRIKQGETALRESEERHRLLASDLQEANRRLEEFNRLKTEFVANMSHELRTPLNAIIGFAQLARLSAGDQPVPKPYLEAMQRILRNSRHLLSLIDDVLDIAKLEAGRIKLHREHFNIAELVQSSFGELQSLAQQKGIGYRLRIPAELPLVFSDPLRVRQIVVNLLSNAIKFTERGTVEVELSSAGEEHFQIVVRDTGVGIDKESLDIIFERFRQVDGSMTRSVGGTGLGLSIVQQVCALLGGRVEVKSKPGEGSVFTAILPYSAPDIVGDPALMPQLNTVLAEALRGLHEDEDDQRPLVLIIEDDEDAAALLYETIRQSKYRVRHASYGAEGLRLARELEPSAITLDVMMPDMDGWRTMQSLKSDPLTANIPVIVCSIVDNRPLGYHLGASDYFVKPVEPEKLISTLQNLCTSGNDASEGYVLVLDDEHGIRELLTKVLRNSGFNVHSAANGEMALKMAAQSPPRAILCDLMMPNSMSGFEFIARLRADKKNEQTPVVVITGKDLTAEDRRLISGQIADVIRKGDLLISDIASRLRDTLTALGVTPADGKNTVG